MEESGFHSAVGFILAILFATVMGLSVFAVLYTDALSGGVINDQEKTTLTIAAMAGALAALISWLLQSFAAHRSFAVRLVYGLLIFLLIFCALGGLFKFSYGIATSQGSVDFSPSGLYFSSLSAFYAFAFSLFNSSLPAFLGLNFAAGLILASVGPRKVY